MAGKKEELFVIGAGFGRTGTSSTKAALEQLGLGPCHHMKEVFQNDGHAQAFLDASNGKEVDWHTLLQKYGSTIDWPSCTFYKELMEAYPNAKVLLTVREPEKWYASARGTIYEASTMNHLLFVRILKAINPKMKLLNDMIQSVVWQGTFDGKFEDKERSMEIFRQHNQAVKDYVPADRLLEFRVTDGWGPLCEFLGVEAPDTPYPHLNDSAEFRKMNTMFKRADLVLKTVLAVTPVLAAWGLYQYFGN